MSFRLEESLGYLVRSTMRALQVRFNQNLSDAGFVTNADEWAILVTLHHNDGQSQQFLGYITHRDKASVTRLVDHLEKRRLVHRVLDPLDRRQKLVHLTADGQQHYREVVPVVEKTLREAQKGIDPMYIKICKNVLGDVLKNVSGE